MPRDERVPSRERKERKRPGCVERRNSSRRSCGFLPFVAIPLCSFLQYSSNPQLLPRNLTVSNTTETSYPKKPWTPPVSNTTSHIAANHSLLVAQYAAPRNPHLADNKLSNDVYDQMLDLTSVINQAYCVAWKCDYWILRGIPALNEDDESSSSSLLTPERYVVDGERQRIVPPLLINEEPETTNTTDVPVASSRSTYNKVVLLELATLHETKYDRLLILDADAMLYDFDRPIASAVPDKGCVFTAHKTHRNDPPGTGSINVGVTVWNLRDPLTPIILQKWKQMCGERVRNGLHDDDQAPLQSLLKKQQLDQTKRNRVVCAVNDEFAYAKGRWVKHFIRRSDAWGDDSGGEQQGGDVVRGAERLAQIRAVSEEICERYHPICDSIHDDEEKSSNESKDKTVINSGFGL